VFDSLDSSGDHSLSVDEFVQASQQLNLGLSAEQAAAKFAELDDNKSGALSLSEFVAFAATL
jgi:Ca2+-binding EF-hand superfamily protein